MGVFIWIFNFALILGLSITSTAEEDAGPGYEDYQVYSAVINDSLLYGNPRSINISDQTNYPDFLDNLLCTNPPFSRGPQRLKSGTLESFVKQNNRHYPLQRRFNLSIDYSLVNEENDSHATQIAGFSRVEFSNDKDHALLLRDDAAYWYVSEGTFVLLEKVDGIWKVIATENAYIGE